MSANAYVGGAPIAAALKGGADVVITWRAADPSLFLGPTIYEFGWAMDDWPMLSKSSWGIFWNVPGRLETLGGGVTRSLPLGQILVLTIGQMLAAVEVHREPVEVHDRANE